MGSDHRDESTNQSENDDGTALLSSNESQEPSEIEENGNDRLPEIDSSFSNEEAPDDIVNQSTKDIDSSNNKDCIERTGEEKSSPNPHLVEIKHLKRRIRNVQEISIQLSRDAIASDLAKYENNCLNATKGCVNEWRAIARYYGTTSDGADDEEGISSALRTEVGLVVFQLIQLSVQSGPLSGGKPGYFKRCGAEVARVVLEFLEEVVPGHDELGIDCMGFSPNQMNAMKKWIVNAKKAVENDKPPSRTATKKMKQLQHKVEKQNLQKRNKMKRKEKKLAKASS